MIITVEGGAFPHDFHHVDAGVGGLRQVWLGFIEEDANNKIA
jgi:hypothetical protein